MDERAEWLRANGYSTYQDYVRSSRWTRTKRDYYERNPKECWVCRSTESVVLHHRTYGSIGAEPDVDLIALCSPCHSMTHWKGLSGGIADRCVYLRQLIDRDGMTGYRKIRERHAKAKRKAAKKGITNAQAKDLASLQKRAGVPYSGAGMTCHEARLAIAQLADRLRQPCRALAATATA